MGSITFGTTSEPAPITPADVIDWSDWFTGWFPSFPDVEPTHYQRNHPAPVDPNIGLGGNYLQYLVPPSQPVSMFGSVPSYSPPVSGFSNPLMANLFANLNTES